MITQFLANKILVRLQALAKLERKVTRHFVFFIQEDEFTRFVSIITGKYIVFKLQNYSELFLFGFNRNLW